MTDNAAGTRDPEVVELLQQMIRNACVNDGRDASGDEVRSVELSRSDLAGPGSTSRCYEPQPGAGRSWPGSRAATRPRRPAADWATPTSCPSTRTSWTRDPFAGELVDG